MKAMTSRALKAIFAVSLGAISTAAFAQADYPTRPIKLIVPFTAGGGVDTVARIVGEELKGVLGQSVVIENLPGASGMRGGRKPPFVRSRTATPFCCHQPVKPR